MVLTGDASDEELLFEEHIENIDLFCRHQMMKRILCPPCWQNGLGRKVIILVQRPAYLHLIQGGTIDIAISHNKLLFLLSLVTLEKAIFYKFLHSNLGLQER